MEREHIIDETCRIRTVTTSDRGGQDKARKVRAVGRGKRLAISTMLQTSFAISSAPCDLRQRVITAQLSAPYQPNMTGNDDFRVRPGRIRSTRAPRTKPFLAQALQAAQKAGGFPRGRTRGAAARLGVAAPQALLRRGSSTTAPAAPSSRHGLFARCARAARCVPMSDISSATG